MVIVDLAQKDALENLCKSLDLHPSVQDSLESLKSERQAVPHTTPMELFFASSGSRHLLHQPIAKLQHCTQRSCILGLHLASDIEEGRMPLDFDLFNSQALQACRWTFYS